MNSKDVAIQVYEKHIALASTDGRLFRKTVREELMATTGCSESAASTHYNNAKKHHENTQGAIPGLGRQQPTKGARRVSTTKSTTIVEEVPENECFTVIELLQGDLVGRMQSFVLQGDASETLDSKSAAWPNSTWVMIQGMGPNPGDDFKLGEGEKEIRRYTPAKETVDVV